MFIDFEKVFNKAPQKNIPIPKPLIEQLSSELPKGFTYDLDEETNTLTIVPDKNNDEEIIIKGISIMPTKEQLEILGDNYKLEDVMALSYNSQQPVPIMIKDGKSINIGGKDVSIERLSFRPFEPSETRMEHMQAIPLPFVPPFSITVGSEKTKIQLLVKRIPNNSISIAAFESAEKKCLSVKYLCDPNTNTPYFSMTMNISFKNAQSVKEIVESIEVYNAFIDGKGYFFDTLVPSRLDTTDASKYDDKAIEFWQKVLKLEKELKITFKPPFEDLDFEDLCDIEEIYQNIINKIPIRQNQSINSITSEWEFSKDDFVSETLGKPICFEFEGTSSVKLFGQVLELPCIIGVFNAIWSNYQKDDDKKQCTIFLENLSDEQQMYTSTLRFLNKEALAEFKEKTPNRLKMFADAKRKHEFLLKER